MKKIVLLLILLSGFLVNGQNAIQDSLTIPLSMARLIEQDLIEKDYLLIEVDLQKSEIKLLEERLAIGLKKEQNLHLQFSLAQKKAENFKTLWEAEKKKKGSKWDRVKDVLLGVGIGALLILIK